jgi:hypothetical protein
MATLTSLHPKDRTNAERSRRFRARRKAAAVAQTVAPTVAVAAWEMCASRLGDGRATAEDLALAEHAAAPGADAAAGLINQGAATVAGERCMKADPLDLSTDNRVRVLLEDRERQMVTIRRARLIKDEIEVELREEAGRRGGSVHG